MSGIHREYPFEMVELACDSCNRRGRLRKSRLTEQHGADYGVARLRETLRPRGSSAELSIPP
jgi:hypothetical protein